MNDFITVIIPFGIDVDSILKPLNFSETKEKSFKDDIFLFLSLIYISEREYFSLKLKKGYTSFSSTWFKSLFGSSRFYDFSNLLIDNEVVEKNHSWKNAENKIKSYCQGYKICDKYLNGKSTFKTISLKTTYRKYFSSNSDGELVSASSIISNDPVFTPILNQFEKYRLSLNDNVFIYLYNFCNSLYVKLLNDRKAHSVKNFNVLNQYQLQKFYSLIGRYVISIYDFNNGRIWHSYSNQNNRLSTSITGLKKGFRNFLSIEGVDTIWQVDVKSSQPYILASIMSSGFMKNLDEGYNLKTIYPELYEKLKPHIEIDFMSLNDDIIDDNSDDIRKRVFAYTKALKAGDNIKTSHGALGMIKNYYSISDKDEYLELKSSGTISIWGKFYNQKDIDSIVAYRKADFTKNFYLNVAGEYKRINPDDVDVFELRQRFKSTLMYILFDDNKLNRKNNANIRIFTDVFTGVNKWIEGILKLTSKREFAYLMQRAESYLINKIIVNEFIQTFPNAPAFTIHDAILTSSEYIYDLENLLKNRLFEVTGIQSGADVTELKKKIEPDLKDIQKAWSKIRPINSKKSYEKAKHKIFDSHVEMGRKFLEYNGLLNLL